MKILNKYFALGLIIAMLICRLGLSDEGPIRLDRTVDLERTIDDPYMVVEALKGLLNDINTTGLDGKITGVFDYNASLETLQAIGLAGFSVRSMTFRTYYLANDKNCYCAVTLNFFDGKDREYILKPSFIGYDREGTSFRSSILDSYCLRGR